MSLRGPMMRSHLRQVSAASLETQSSLEASRSTATPAPQDGGNNLQSTLDETTIRLSSTGLDRRQCTLWVHDETFSREEILFNQAAFSDMGVQTGDVIEILPNRSTGDASGTLKPELGSRLLRDTHVDTGSTLHADAKSKFKTPLQSRCLFVVKPIPPETLSRNPKLEISITSSVANIFGLKNRAQVWISIVDRAQCSASHVDVSFRDQYLVRSDMWRLVMSELADKIVYKGQKILFMGSIKATVKNIFIRGKKALSGYFSPHTIPVFRSESAKYVLFIQMSREMWDFDSEGTGDILFSRVINGFLPELFKRWASSDAKHLVTIVLFTRVEYDASSSTGLSTLTSENLKSANTPNNAPTRDFYRVVVNDMASGHWTTILDELKKDFRSFLRDVSILRVDDADTPTVGGARMASKPYPATIAGRPSTALRGNILEAIHLASSHLAFDHIDRDMVHTGTSIIVITPGSGVFEVSYESLATTTEALTNRGIAIDLVCLSPMPLHSVPLFKYREPVPRPSSSAFGDMPSGSCSPEMRHSFASFPSRSSHLSPKTTMYDSFSRMSPGDHVLPRTKEWNYGIPHWLDISYWNPETYREARRILKNDPNAPIPFTVTKQSKAFVPRVRMYEIQMMGVMESEQSNISIPYLLEGQGISRVPNSGLLSPTASFTPSKSSFRHSSPYKVQLSDSLRPEPFLQHMTNPRDMMAPPASKKSPKSMLSWMDQYDDSVFQPFPRRRQRRKPKIKRSSEPDVPISTAHERLSARSVLRLREHENNSNEREHSVRATPRKIDPSLSTGKGPVLSKAASPKKPALKAPSAVKSSRISRTISFALRGLSATPPRAQASTEVKAEHVKALPMFNQRPSIGGADTKSIDSLSPSESASTSTIAEQTSRPPTPQMPIQNSAITPSRPISIKIPPKKTPEDTEEPERPPALPESFSTTATEIPYNGDARPGSQPKKTGPKFEMTVNQGMRDGSSRHSPGRALAPWVRSINPCNTPKTVSRDTSWFGRWQHAYPRPPHVAVVKWKSLKSPAVLPLTTEEFPRASELGSDYLQTPYRVFQNDDLEGIDAPKTRSVLLREMISVRLAHGFQIIVGKNVAEAMGQPALESLNVFDTSSLERDGATVFLSKGNAIHRIICVDGGEIEVTRFMHRVSSTLSYGQRTAPTVYSPAMRTILSPEYMVKDIALDPSTEEYNWNYADNYIAGHRDYLFNPAQQLHFWRVRYVLIPMQLHVNSRRHLQSFNEDNEEEIHLLGISHLTHIWQRYKYVPQEEKRFESSNKTRDQNPLNIMYQTRNQSEVVAAELDRLLLADPRLDNPPAQLLPESELLERSSIILSSFAQVIQGDKGVRMMDRRWHWRLHYNCFIGFELTTWLLQNFRDIDSREEAVDFGNELMKHGLFQHVERRHNFRDGNYFYQISSEYRYSRPESRGSGSWFPPKRSDKSVPSTPAGERPRDSPISAHARNESLETPIPVPSTPSRSKNKVAIMLSKSMKYDVDPRKRSNRPEVIDLHYDRLHNPENCFHIELSWMNTTPKLIEDAVVSWASTAEKFGLKLVQVPVAEASAIDKTQPFRKPYRITLKVPPPKGPVPTLFNSVSFAQPGAPDHLYYQKAILRKFDFVLDFEARSAFPADVEVSYSWGIPDYQYPQYIHRSGSILVQITDEGDFLLLANRLVSTRGPAAREFPRVDRPEQYRARAATYDPLDRLSPRLSPLARPTHDPTPMSPQGQPTIDSANLYRAPEYILHGLQDFCHDAARLEQFYSESHVRPVSTRVGPASTVMMDSSIPSLELPASVVSHHISPPPGLPSRLASHDGIVPSELARGRGRTDSLSFRGSPRSGPLRPIG